MKNSLWLFALVFSLNAFAEPVELEMRARIGREPDAPLQRPHPPGNGGFGQGGAGGGMGAPIGNPSGGIGRRRYYVRKPRVIYLRPLKGAEEAEAYLAKKPPLLPHTTAPCADSQCRNPRCHTERIEELCWNQATDYVDCCKSVECIDKMAEKIEDYIFSALPKLHDHEVNYEVDLDQIPDESYNDYVFHSEHAERLDRLYKDLYKAPVTGKRSAEAKVLGLHATKTADISYAANDGMGEFYEELGKEFLDIAVGLDPISGFGRSAFELFTGRNMVTRERLTPLERSFAFLGVATAGNSRWIGQAAKGMRGIYRGAIHFLKSRHGMLEAIQEGERLLEKGRPTLRNWSNKHGITHFEEAAEANARYVGKPPYQPDSFLTHFVTKQESNFVRLSNEHNPIGTWLVRKGEIKGLTPQQIADKLNLPTVPTHIAPVKIPPNVKMSRGMTNFNEWEREAVQNLEGQVQYRIEQALDPRWFGERTLL